MIRRSSRLRELSGPQWVDRYPGDRTTATLVQPFRKQVQSFIFALEAAGAHVKISATFRPPQRAYLMVMAYGIWRHEIEPHACPRRDDVPINWEHPTLRASWEAAKAMVEGYGIVHRPSLTSRHTEGRAIDCTITWTGRIEVVDGEGARRVLSSAKGTMNNPDLHAVGASYGVHKLRTDPPHWSDDGH
jgi:D-alanyl-D-alanine dipeptidase